MLDLVYPTNIARVSEIFSNNLAIDGVDHIGHYWITLEKTTSNDLASL